MQIHNDTREARATKLLPVDRHLAGHVQCSWRSKECAYSFDSALYEDVLIFNGSPRRKSVRPEGVGKPRNGKRFGNGHGFRSEHESS